MNSKDKNRLSALENATRKADPTRPALLVVYADDDNPGIYWENPTWSNDRGNRYTRAELDKLDPANLFIVENGP